MKAFWGVCGSCARWNPGSSGNCILSKDVGALQKKHSELGEFHLMVMDCYLFVPIEEVFPLEPTEAEEPTPEEKPKKGKKKK